MSEFPTCSRCGLKAASAGRSKCANCGMEYGKSFALSKGSTTGPIAPPITALPKCKRCGSIGKTGHKNCVFCGLAYGESVGTAKGAVTEGPSVPKTLPRCLRCGTIGKGGHKNCVFCGLAYGEQPSISKGTTEGPTVVSQKNLPKCSRCKAVGSLGSSKCNFCGKPWSDEDYTGETKEPPKPVVSGPVVVPPSALPKCSRCKSWGKLSSDKCTFCGKPFESSDYGGGSSGSDKKDTPVLEGPSHPTVTVLPKCTRCGSIGKLSSDKCTFCSKPYTDEDYGGKAPSKSTVQSSGPSSDLPKCNRCGSKGLAGASKCAYCGFPYGEAFTGSSTTSTSTPSTTTTTDVDTYTGDTTSSGSGSSTPAFCGCCGSPAEGGSFCGVCGEPF